MRYFFEISYKGTAYHGWQRQKNALSVQQVLEERLSTFFRSQMEITGSGRTDTGVHACKQVFHADLPPKVKPEILKNRMNSFLPNDINIHKILQVKDKAHARYDAINRSYEYWIIREKNPFIYDLAYLFKSKLSVDKMNIAAKVLVGEKDFKCFSRVKTDVDDFVCNISRAKWVEDTGVLKFRITANRFLRGMVRTIVGTLLDIGQERKTIEDLKSIIKSRDRKSAGRAVPAKGLYLTEVKYPDSIFLK